MREWLYVLFPIVLTAYFVVYPAQLVRLMTWLGGCSIDELRSNRLRMWAPPAAMPHRRRAAKGLTQVIAAPLPSGTGVEGNLR